MLRDYMAARELERVTNLAAFNVEGYSKRQRINQHATLYDFPDGSSLMLHTTRQFADTWHKDWKGRADDVNLGPIKARRIQANRSS